MDSDRPFPQIPVVTSETWEDFSVFRETFLGEVCEVPANETLRAFGNLQLELVYESSRPWPYRFMDSTARSLQAVLADLRFIQSFLESVCERTEANRDGDREESGGDEALVKLHDALCDLGKRVSLDIGKLADEIEGQVGGWHFQPLRRDQS